MEYIALKNSDMSWELYALQIMQIFSRKKLIKINTILTQN